jgi:hypothetical protein
MPTTRGSPSRRLRLPKTGDEVAALLDEAERAMEPHESEDGASCPSGMRS